MSFRHAEDRTIASVLESAIDRPPDRILQEHEDVVEPHFVYRLLKLFREFAQMTRNFYKWRH